MMYVKADIMVRVEQVEIWRTYHILVAPNPPLDFTWQTVAIPILDHLLLEMESHWKTALLELYLIPSILINSSLQDMIEKLGPLEGMT